MSMMLGKGIPVKVKDLGEGIVVRATKIGAVVSLEKYGGLEIEVKHDQIASLVIPKPETISSTQVPLQPVTAKAPNQIAVDDDFLSARSLEALRFGLVPEQHIEELTLGYELLKEWVYSCLPHRRKDRPGLFEVSGPFGTGKSHTMAVIRYLARKEGYLTARVEVDGQTISLSEPGKLLNSLWSTLIGNDFESITPLTDLILSAISKGYQPVNLANQGIDRVRDIYSTIQYLKRMGLIEKYIHEIETVLSSGEEFTATQVNSLIKREPGIAKEQITLRPAVGKAVYERTYNFLENLVGYAVIAQLAGYKGLIIAIDEFEVEYNLTRTKLQRVSELIAVLTDYLTGDSDFCNAPLAFFIATVGQDGHVGDTLVDFMLERTGEKPYVLKAWDNSHLRELARNIDRLYSKTYSVSIPVDSGLAASVEQLLSKNGYEDSGLIRAFIKWYVGMLDIKYGPPEGL